MCLMWVRLNKNWIFIKNWSVENFVVVVYIKLLLIYIFQLLVSKIYAFAESVVVSFQINIYRWITLYYLGQLNCLFITSAVGFLDLSQKYIFLIFLFVFSFFINLTHAKRSKSIFLIYSFEIFILFGFDFY